MKLKYLRSFLFFLIMMNCPVQSKEPDSLIANEVVSFYKEIQTIIKTGKQENLRKLFISDTVEYFRHACPDEDTVGNLSKYVWGSKGCADYVIGAFSHHRLKYIIPQNDSIVWTSNYHTKKQK